MGRVRLLQTSDGNRTRATVVNTIIILYNVEYCRLSRRGKKTIPRTLTVQQYYIIILLAGNKTKDAVSHNNGCTFFLIIAISQYNNIIPTCPIYSLTSPSGICYNFLLNTLVVVGI